MHRSGGGSCRTRKDRALEGFREAAPSPTPFGPFQAPGNTDGQDAGRVDTGDPGMEVRKFRLFQCVLKHTSPGCAAAQAGGRSWMRGRHHRTEDHVEPVTQFLRVERIGPILSRERIAVPL